MFPGTNATVRATTAALFEWDDYMVFGAMLVISMAIGIYFGCCGKEQITPAEYLLGNRKMTVLPVGLSLVASHISGGTLVGVPAEVYSEGAMYILMVPALFVACIFFSTFFLPVFCELKVTSAFEYLEYRFNRKARTIASFYFLTGCLCFLPPVLYIPSLSLSQATGFNLHAITFVVTFVCVFYTTIGGLKAVVWTDFIQTIVTVVACVLIVVIGTRDVGGVSHVLNVAAEGGRLNIFNMDINPFQRNTFWTMTMGTFFAWTSGLVSSQACIQRFMAVPTLRHAQKTLLVYWFGMSFLTTLSIYAGLLIYAVYLGCDPIEHKIVEKPDQMYPYFVMDKIGYVPILPGLFIAGIFSAALSTLSTILNAIAATVYEDHIKQYNLSDTLTNLIMKCIVVGVGCFAVIMVFVVEKLGNILAVSYIIAAVTGTPLFTMFLMGMVFPSSNYRGVITGSLCSILFVIWVAYGASTHRVNHGSTNIYSHVESTCGNSNRTTSSNNSNDEPPKEVFFLYKLSYMVYKLCGCIVSCIICYVVSHLTGATDAATIDPVLIAPPLRRFLPKRKMRSVEENGMTDVLLKS